jgi:hypothetical protein
VATVIVPSVWPPGSNVSITGLVVSGDGHVVGASPGVQFGSPTVVTKYPAGGVPSAQAFGVTRAVGLQVVSVGGVPTAKAFGSDTVKPGAVIVPVPGVPQYPADQVSITGQVISGDGHLVGQTTGTGWLFGQITFKTAVTVQVQGFYPYPTYIPSITGGVIAGDGHVVGGYGGTGYQFGHPGFYLNYRLAVTGVPSAQAFGAVKLVQVVHPLGVPSAQAFGTRIGIVFRILGLPSEQAFGSEEFGFAVFIVWIRPAPCEDLDLALSACTDLDLELAACTDLDLDVLVPT